MALHDVFHDELVEVLEGSVVSELDGPVLLAALVEVDRRELSDSEVGHLVLSRVHFRDEHVHSVLSEYLRKSLVFRLQGLAVAAPVIYGEARRKGKK